MSNGFTVSTNSNMMTSYENDGKYARFVGWDGSRFILGTQSGLIGENVNVVRFDETLDVDVYEIVDGVATHCPNLATTWS